LGLIIQCLPITIATNRFHKWVWMPKNNINLK